MSIISSEIPQNFRKRGIGENQQEIVTEQLNCIKVIIKLAENIKYLENY